MLPSRADNISVTVKSPVRCVRSKLDWTSESEAIQDENPTRTVGRVGHALGTHSCTLSSASVRSGVATSLSLLLRTEDASTDSGRTSADQDPPEQDSAPVPGIINFVKHCEILVKQLVKFGKICKILHRIHFISHGIYHISLFY